MPVKRGAQSSKSEIMVSVRIRPGPSPVVGIENGKVAVPGKLFGFPSHIVKGSDQGVAFRHLASVLIARAKEGYNCTLMAYGQTGSGINPVLPPPHTSTTSNHHPNHHTLPPLSHSNTHHPALLIYIIFLFFVQARRIPCLVRPAA